MFFTIMSLINAPLGGQPFTVAKLTDRKKAELKLADQLAALAAEKNKKPVTKEVSSQKEPRYFNSARKNSVVKSGENTALKRKDGPFKHLKNGIPSANTLELVDIKNNGLSLVPDNDLVEKSKYGPLPRIAHNGKRAQDVYARPNYSKYFKDKNIKTVSILVTNLGLSQPVSDNAIEKLPPEVTLSFNPYASQLGSWVKRARRSGHELMLQVPMEPFDYPDNDPGPHTLLSGLSDTVNIQRLKWIMARMTGYIGMVNINGSKFSSDEGAMHPILHELKVRGLTFMDAHPQAPEVSYQVAREIKLDYLQGAVILDRVMSKKAIDQSLKKLEDLARTQGSAIGVMSGLPLSIQRLTEWSASLKKKGIHLVPISTTLIKPS
jgi:polysaccharide deacetylase 2 family uncharacterized protein YibQ